MSSLLSVTTSSMDTGSLVDVRNSLVTTSDGIQVVIQRDDSLMSGASEGSVAEPLAKRPKLEESEIDPSQSIKTILFNINKAVCLRLDAIESKLSSVVAQNRALEAKLDRLTNKDDASQSAVPASPSSKQAQRRGAVVVGLPQDKAESSRWASSVSLASPAAYGTASLVANTGTSVVSPGQSESSQSSSDQMHGSSLGPNVTLITLNSEEDFPNGVWLGDEANPEMRVRVPITPSDLLHIHSNCRTPEKMALSLLDYLFDRDTQATSNLSGQGRHGKKQLDPLMIYGIRCHLIHRFSITEQDWHRIKQNIDSKCRTAFRRRLRGLPLTVKAFRGKAPPTYVHVLNGQTLLSPLGAGGGEDSPSGEVLAQAGDPLGGGHAQGLLQPEILHGAGGGQIQVLHATPEQVAQLQQTHQIQILQGEQVMQLQSAVEDGGLQVAEGVPHDEGSIQVIQADNGETIRIKMDPDDSTEDGLQLTTAETEEEEDEEDEEVE